MTGCSGDIDILNPLASEAADILKLHIRHTARMHTWQINFMKISNV